MKALTIKQPWAGLIFAGLKTIELRSWATKYRGPLLLTVSQKPKIIKAPTGCLLCVVTLVDCRPATKKDAEQACCDVITKGAFAWVLSDVKLIRQVKCRGQFGLWNGPEPHYLK